MIRMMEKLKKGYGIEVSKEDWMSVSRTINIYHRYITGPIYVKSLENTVKCSFDYYVWNSKQIEIMMTIITTLIDGIEVEEI